MNKIKNLLVLLLAFFSFNLVGNAAGSASLTVSRTTIENGTSVTAYINLSNVAAWNVSINSSGATSGCSQKFVGDSGTGKNINRTFSVTCRATSIGIINFAISGDITSSDLTNTSVSGSRSVTVTRPVPVAPKSTNNYLKSLSVEGASLTPKFNKTTLEYSVELEPKTEKIKISAQVEDSKASLKGTGTITVSEGDNKINVVVTAENGNQRTYVINARVKELEPIEVTIDGKKYTVVRKKEELTMPLTYIERTSTINDEEVPSFYSEFTKFTLVGLKDSEGKIGLYIYDEKDNTYELYNELDFNKLALYIKEPGKGIHIPSGYNKTKITIKDNEITAYKFNSKSKYSLIYGMNIETGEEHLYMYDSEENTIQRYNGEEVNELNKKINDYTVIITTLALFSFISFIIIIFFIIKNRKIIKRVAAIENNFNGLNNNNIS